MNSAPSIRYIREFHVLNWLIKFTRSLFFLLGLAGCGSFQGPGPFHAGATERGPTVTLRGERQTLAKTNDINFDWPVDEARLSRGFKTGKMRSHWGIDLAYNRGTPILAAEKGRVIYRGREFRGYGNLVVIEHNEEWATMYAHLDKINVQEGDTVNQGEVIGKMGRTGNARGTHLHFEIRHHRQPVNPLQYLPARNPLFP